MMTAFALLGELCLYGSFKYSRFTESIHVMWPSSNNSILLSYFYFDVMELGEVNHTL